MYTNWRNHRTFQTEDLRYEDDAATQRFESIMAPDGEVITGFDAVLEVGSLAFHIRTVSILKSELEMDVA